MHDHCIKSVVFKAIHIKLPVLYLHINIYYDVICFQTTEQGAQTSIYLAVSEDVAKTSGKYFKDCKVNMILLYFILYFISVHRACR